MRGVLFFVLHPRRLLVLVGGVIAATLYVWFAAVRAVPDVRRRKRAWRRAWRQRERRRPAPR